VLEVSRYIEGFAPDLVLTFDPRHGTTCHPDHRAVGEIVLAAVQLLEKPPEVYLLETRVTYAAEPFAVTFAPAIPGAIRFDATNSLASTAGPAWNAIIADVQRHPSQFDSRWIDAVSNVPSNHRAVFIAPLAMALSSAIEQPCP
jgi:LmbE family N-acetylglucosaminyl deacetylase